VSQTSIPPVLRQQIAKRDRFRCCYCPTLEAITGAYFTIDHILPEALGGQTTLDNLCLACWPCNLPKAKRIVAVDLEINEVVRLFHPTQQRWHENFAWSADGLLIIGLTPTGRATITALRLNAPEQVNGRRIWIEAGRHPPST